MLRLVHVTMCLLFTTHLSMSACPDIVPRADWGAAPPVSRQVLTSLPVPYVVIHHTFLPGFCNTSDTCKTAMSSMQNYHQNTQKWDDIGYHFCIGGTGLVYEGRGWDVIGTHAPNYNSRSTGICFIGDFRMSACPDIVPRADWRAAPPFSRQVLTSLPVPYVVIHHTFQPGFCNTSVTCQAAMRSIQNYHKNTKHWNDIGYHFCVGGTGQVYEGRGWDVIGSHAPNYNSRSIGIVFIGNFSTELPTPDMLAAAKSLIECGVERGSISREYKLLGHSQVRETMCPGTALLNEIKTWPRWDSLNNTST